MQRNHALDLEKVETRKDAEGREWYVLTVEGKEGAVQKEKAEIVTQHDWAKLGFRVIEDDDTKTDGYLDPENIPAFFKDIHTRLDADHTGEVTPRHIQ